MDTIISAIKKYAGSPQHSDRLCIGDASGDLSYKELWDRVKRFSIYLKENHKDAGYAVIYCTQNREFVVAVLGCQLSGIVTVPVEKGAAKAGILEIMESLDKPVVFIGTEPQGDAGFIDIGGILKDQAAKEGASLDKEELPERDAVAEILFSTGTTGKSKGIVISHDNNRAIAENIINGVEMGEGNIELIPLPLSHSHGLRTLYANLYNGSSSLILSGVSNLFLFYGMLDKYNATSIDMSPSILNIIMMLSEDKLKEYNKKLDYIELGTAMLPDEDAQRLKALLPDVRLYNFYGSTESGRTCTYDFSHKEKEKYCIGIPAKNAVYSFTDRDRNTVTATKEEPGFIAVKGEQNMVCYYKEEALTESVRKDGFIFTNDLGYMDDEGYIYCLGRSDSIINRGGVKINPEEIESAARKYSLIKDAACIPMDDPLQGQVPVLFVSHKEQGDHDMKAFEEFLKENLDLKKLPEKIKVIDDIPRAGNGKILKARLKELLDV